MRRARLDRGWSQRQAADFIGVSQAQINAYEHGRSLPLRGKHPKVAELLDVDVADVTAAWMAAQQAATERRNATEDERIAELERRLDVMTDQYESLLEMFSSLDEQLRQVLRRRSK